MGRCPHSVHLLLIKDTSLLFPQRMQMYVHIRCVLFRMCAYNEYICFGIFQYVCTIVYVYTFIYVCIIICIYIFLLCECTPESPFKEYYKTQQL